MLKEKLLLHRRIKEVTVNSEFSWWKDDYSEFYLDLDRLRMAKEHITATQLFAALRPVFGRDIYCGNVLFDSQTEQLKLSSVQGQRYDVWGLVNIPFFIDGRSYKLADFATVRKGQSPQKVAKENQQYRLCLQYEYIGSSEQGKKLLKKDLEIAIPADDSRTREKFQELSKVSKLVFISNVPDGMSKNSYVSCVSVNESENGTNTGRMLGEYCKENKKKKAGFIIHGAAFYGTRVRDNAAERIIMSRLLHLSGHIWKNLLTMSRFSSKRGCLGILFLYMSRLVLFPGLFTSLFLHMSRVSLSPGLFTSLFLHMSKTPPKNYKLPNNAFQIYINAFLAGANADET